jgi:hypothetical protein
MRFVDVSYPANPGLLRQHPPSDVNVIKLFYAPEKEARVFVIGKASSAQWNKCNLRQSLLDKRTFGYNI